MRHMNDQEQQSSVLEALIAAGGNYAAPTVLLIVLFALFWAQRRPRRTYKHPPGPKGIPLLGYLPFLGTNHHQLFLDLSKIYGPVVRVRFGTANIVVLNDTDSIKEGFMNAKLQSRSNNVFFDQAGNPGVATLNGEAWKDNRTVSLRILHELGLFNSTLYQVLQEEVDILTKSLHDLKERPVIVRRYLVPSLSNVISSLLFGVRHRKEHKTRVALDKLFADANRALTTGTLVVFLPSWLYQIAGMVPFTRLWSIRTAFIGILRYIMDHVKHHEGSLTAHHTRDFIDGYLKRAKKRRGASKNSHILQEYIAGNALAFFGSGTNAISRNIIWHLVNLADKPDTVQKNIQREIDNVVGRERQPRWEDRYNMPYTMAVIQEMHRWRPISPLGLPRGALEDLKICGYDIPEGTVVMANFWAASMNVRDWKNPEEFNPYRFLNDDGITLKPRPQCYIPFSVGKRMCPSEALSNVETFCYITGILQKFNVLPKEGEIIDLSINRGTLNWPKEQQIRFLPRLHEDVLVN